MNLNLFAPSRSLEPLGLEDADVRMAHDLDLPRPPDELLTELIATTPWRSESVTLYGKKFLQPRLTAWHGDGARTYSYSGLTLTPAPWTPTLLAIREGVQALTNAEFNSVLLNFYRDHRDSIGLHSDDERELGPAPVIASLSLGATRTMVFRPRLRSDLKSVRVKLPSGSLLLMQGSTQAQWKHGIDKQTAPCGPRVNLTFRRVFPG